jgi:hypothetical protein
MRTRWGVALGCVLGLAGLAGAEPVPPPASSVVPSVQPPSVQPKVQGQLPPLLPVPRNPDPPLAEVPRPGPPGFEYDPGYQYLPEHVPERRLATDDLCGPPGRWWVAPSLELAWVPARSLPANVRIRLPDPVSLGGTLPGPVLPTARRSAGRFDAALGLVVGHWFDEANTRGAEVNFFLRDAYSTFDVVGPGTVVFPPRRGRDEVTILPVPDVFGLSVVSVFPATLETFFTTVDVNYRQRLYCSDNARLDALVGYRYAHLGDELYLGEIGDSDDYRNNRAAVLNDFHGGQVGLAGEFRGGGWYIAGSAKVAFGGTNTEVKSSGVFVGAEGQNGGGRFRRLNALTRDEWTDFAVMPAFSVQVGRQVAQHIRLFGGYSFLYLSRVGRLADALSPNNSAVPSTDFWVQSIGLGAEFRF